MTNVIVQHVRLELWYIWWLKKKQEFCVSIVFQSFSLTCIVSCWFSQKMCAILWSWLLNVTLICFHSFIPSFLLSFHFLPKQTACHVHPNWPAGLHIGFLMFLANRLSHASKGMIYALKLMNEKPYLSCFQIQSV